MGIAEQLLDASFDSSRKYLIALCSGSSHARACAARKVYPVRGNDTVIRCLDIPGCATPPLLSARRISRSAARRGMAYTSRRIRGARTLRVTHQRYHADFVVYRHRQRGARRPACFTDAFRTPSAGQRCASVRKSGSRPARLPGFEFRAIARLPPA